MTFLSLALYALLILLATIAGDKAQAVADEIRGRVCKFWDAQVKPVLSCILRLSKGWVEGWRIGR